MAIVVYFVFHVVFKSGPIVFKSRILEFLGIFLLSYPYEMKSGNVYSLWGGFSKSNIVSLCAVFQFAEGNAFSLLSICIFQKAERTAVSVFGFVFIQGAVMEAIQIFGIGVFSLFRPLE